MQNQTCFLLSYVKYGDNDAVLHCFSAESGYQSFFAKGIYSPKSRKRAYLFPLNELEIIVNHSREGQIPTVNKLELLQSFYDEKDLNKNAVLMFSSEFLYQILRHENGNIHIYNEVQMFLRKLSHKNPVSHIAFVFNILRYNGLIPLSTSSASERFLDPETGRFVSSKSHHIFDENISAIWKKFGSEEDNYTFMLSRSERNLFLESLMWYYKIHFNDFQIPESLEVLRQVYE